MSENDRPLWIIKEQERKKAARKAFEEILNEELEGSETQLRWAGLSKDTRMGAILLTKDPASFADKILIGDPTAGLNPLFTDPQEGITLAHPTKYGIDEFKGADLSDQALEQILQGRDPLKTGITVIRGYTTEQGKHTKDYTLGLSFPRIGETVGRIGEGLIPVAAYLPTIQSRQRQMDPASPHLDQTTILRQFTVPLLKS